MQLAERVNGGQVGRIDCKSTVAAVHPGLPLLLSLHSVTCCHPKSGLTMAWVGILPAAAPGAAAPGGSTLLETSRSACMPAECSALLPGAVRETRTTGQPRAKHRRLLVGSLLGAGPDPAQPHPSDLRTYRTSVCAEVVLHESCAEPTVWSQEVTQVPIQARLYSQQHGLVFGIAEQSCFYQGQGSFVEVLGTENEAQEPPQARFRTLA